MYVDQISILLGLLLINKTNIMAEITKTLEDFKKEIANPNEALKAFIAYLASVSDKSIFNK
jgi:hypothetical protein